MRKFVILSLLAIATLSLYAQAEFKQTKYPNGNIKMEGYFENGNPVGEIKRYHENGVLQGIQRFAADGSSKAEIYAEEDLDSLDYENELKKIKAYCSLNRHH